MSKLDSNLTIIEKIIESCNNRKFHGRKASQLIDSGSMVSPDFFSLSAMTSLVMA